MSLKAKLLRTKDLSDTFVAMALHLADNARARLRDEMTRKKINQRELAQLLDWSQSRVAKVLTGRVSMSLDDLEALCFALSLSPVEVVRDHGLEFCAELKPTELRLLERFRQFRPEDVDGFMRMLRVATQTQPQNRHANLPKKAVKSSHVS